MITLGNIMYFAPVQARVTPSQAVRPGLKYFDPSAHNCIGDSASRWNRVKHAENALAISAVTLSKRTVNENADGRSEGRYGKLGDRSPFWMTQSRSAFGRHENLAWDDDFSPLEWASRRHVVRSLQVGVSDLITMQCANPPLTTLCIHATHIRF